MEGTTWKMLLLQSHPIANEHMISVSVQSSNIDYELSSLAHSNCVLLGLLTNSPIPVSKRDDQLKNRPCKKSWYPKHCKIKVP